MNQYDHDHDRVRRRVAVIGGGANDEHEVSLASAAAVVRALRARGDDVVALTIDRDGRWRRTDGPRVTAAEAVAALTTCDAAFPLLHGERGEDGAAAGLLVLVGVPIVGSPVRAGALAMDKWVTKVLAARVGITTAPGSLVTTSGGSSNGVGVVHDRAALDDAVGRARAAGDGRVLVESFVVGREVDVALFRDRSGALRPGWTLEIAVAERSVFGRDEKYDGTADFTVPARITAAEHDSVLAAARRLYEVLGCAGVARFDFFVTADGVVLNEVNTTPGFTERSQVPLMYAATGLDYPDLVGELVEAALH
jgi:D-alanine-D-alanine ligase-like ATP-grasp enzyme